MTEPVLGIVVAISLLLSLGLWLAVRQLRNDVDWLLHQRPTADPGPGPCSAPEPRDMHSPPRV